MALDAYSRVRWEENSLFDVRPGSTFESFNPEGDGQKRTAAMMLELAQSLVEQRGVIGTQLLPFDTARWIHLWGQPGRGKTHLIEALVNYLRVNAPEVYERIYLDRKDFTHRHMTYGFGYWDAPIIILDDLFKENQVTNEFHPRVEVEALINWAIKAYESRRLVIVTSNFPMYSAPVVKRPWPWGEGLWGTGLFAPRSVNLSLLDHLRATDWNGRAASRLQQMMGPEGEFLLDGPDHRMANIKR